MNKNAFSNHIKLKNVKIDDDFWSGIQSKVEKTVIPYQYEALNDRIPNAEKSFCVENFKKAAKAVVAMKNGEAMPKYPTDKWFYNLDNSDEKSFHGWVFQDSDAYKWLEAVAYSLVNKWDKDLFDRASDLIDLICSAQMENGYLDTIYIINNPDSIFTNLRDHHELYCFGHLAEAAVAFFDATGDRRLLDTAIRFADLICDTFGEGKKRGYGGHEISELAMVKLYKATGDEKYLDMAEFFVNERGKKPYYFDVEQGKKTVDDNYFYNQAHIPPRQQREAVGHAVRAVYLYSGMTDVAREKSDDELYDACVALWDNITNRKMYITGGIGSTVDGEAFTQDYDLPNDLAYCETCASIGLVFFGMRMLEITPNAQVADTIERALYNTILSGMNADGDRFFYVNPLEASPVASARDSRKHHIKVERQKWFGCACCPPNLARILGSLGEYCYTEGKDTLYIHQYIGGTVKTKFGDLSVCSSYAKNGSVKLAFSPEANCKIALRIPSWCSEYSFNLPCDIKDGYAYFDVDKYTEITAKYTVAPRLVSCSNNVSENVGRVALCCGPMVYCIEEVDNGNMLHNLKIDVDTTFEFVDADLPKILANGYRESVTNELYSGFKKPKLTSQRLTFVPYYLWGNRGENEMSVYIRY